MKKIFAVIGPTAVGKTKIALDIAEEYQMEIVSCDSMQIYRNMDIGSAKPTPEELSRVPHHMIDVVDPKASYSVVEYQQKALSAIENILDRNKYPLVAGGTGLYLDSLIYDLDYAAKPPDESEREALYKLADEQGPEKLYTILETLDKEAASRIHPNNIKRVVRAIESAREGIGIEAYDKSMKLRPEYRFVLIGLRRDRQELYDRINQRVDDMIEEGLVEEVTKLHDMGLSADDYSMKGIGYKELFPYIDGQISLEDAVVSIKTNSRHYAKRQMTWFSRYDDIKWFDLTGVEIESDYQRVEEEIKEWLKKEF